MNLLKVELNKTIKEMIFYYPDYIVSFIVELFILFLILNVGTEINTSYFSYVTWLLSAGIISETVMCISTEKQLGTLQNLMTKPYSIFQIIGAKILIWYVLNLFKVILFSVGFKLLYFNSLIINMEILFTLILVSLGIFGLSFVMSALTLVYTKTASFEVIISYIILFLSGEIVGLPPIVKYTNPISYSRTVINKIILNEEVFSDMIVLLTVSSVYLLVGYIIFKIVFKNSKDYSWNY